MSGGGQKKVDVRVQKPRTGLKAGAVGFGRKAEAFGLRRNPILLAFALEVA